jgi:hypothetical protein
MTLPPQAELAFLDSCALSDRPPSAGVGLQSNRDLLSPRSGQHGLLPEITGRPANNDANDPTAVYGLLNARYRVFRETR